MDWKEFRRTNNTCYMLLFPFVPMNRQQQRGVVEWKLYPTGRAVNAKFNHVENKAHKREIRLPRSIIVGVWEKGREGKGGWGAGLVSSRSDLKLSSLYSRNCTFNTAYSGKMYYHFKCIAFNWGSLYRETEWFSGFLVQLKKRTVRIDGGNVVSNLGLVIVFD